MFHEKFTFSAQTERCDIRLCAEESFVVRVVGDTVIAVGVVIDEAEVVACAGDAFNAGLEVGETGWDRARGVLVFGGADGGLGCLFDGDE